MIIVKRAQLFYRNIKVLAKLMQNWTLRSCEVLNGHWIILYLLTYPLILSEFALEESMLHPPPAEVLLLLPETLPVSSFAFFGASKWTAWLEHKSHT